MRTPFQVNDRELRRHLRTSEKQTDWFVTGFLYLCLAVMVIGTVGRAMDSRKLLTIAGYGLALVTVTQIGFMLTVLIGRCTHAKIKK